jgi:antirestriction protein
MTYLDSRDLEKEADELRDRVDDGEELDEDEAKRLAEIESLRDEIGEWFDGATLIPEDDFEDYARELAEDIGAIDPDASWPLTYIDWEAAAEALAQDYSLVTLDDVSYYVRD